MSPQPDTAAPRSGGSGEGGARYGDEMIPVDPAPASSPWFMGRRAVALDALLATALAVPMLVRPGRTHQQARAVDVVAVVGVVALLMVRRRFPISALGAGLVLAVTITAITQRPTGVLPAVVILLFAVAVRAERRRAIIAGAAAMVGLLTSVIIIVHNGFIGPELLAAVAWPPLAVAAGDLLRNRRVAIAAAEERAQRAEATREEEARRRVAEERLRIARDLHDVVAHRMAVVNVQAGVAAHLLRTRPEEAEEALAVVRSSAQIVLGELGGILSVLRDTDTPAAPLQPLPDLGALPALVGSFASVGLVVDWTSAGEPPALPESTQLTVYRIVQEALTNAHKHGAGSARLAVTYGPEIEVVVDNPVPLTAEPTVSSGGHGLLGMRERVNAAGGTLEAGRVDARSFRVRVRIPVASRSTNGAA